MVFGLGKMIYSLSLCALSIFLLDMVCPAFWMRPLTEYFYNSWNKLYQDISILSKIMIVNNAHIDPSFLLNHICNQSHMFPAIYLLTSFLVFIKAFLAHLLGILHLLRI